MTTPAKNRGPAAAAANRAALVAAARELFAAEGFAVPMREVARRAGVGQGSLYRHFPDRVALALAVFDDNMVELEAVAARTADFDAIASTLVQQVIDSSAFVDMLDSTDARILPVQRRVEEIVAATLGDAHERGVVHPSRPAEDVLLGLGMLAGLLARVHADDRAAFAGRAWRVVAAGLAAPR